MSVDVSRDCIITDDGSMLCWDDEEGCYYLYFKKKVETDRLTAKDLTKLVAHLSKQRNICKD